MNHQICEPKHALLQNLCRTRRAAQVSALGNLLPRDARHCRGPVGWECARHPGGDRQTWLLLGKGELDGGGGLGWVPCPQGASSP